MELDVSEALRVTILMSGDTNCLDAAGLREEVLEAVLVSVETQVAAENGSGLTRGGLGLVTTSGIAGELNPDLPSIKHALIGSAEGGHSLLMSLELDKGLTLVVQEFALGQSTVSLVELPKTIFSSVV